jgi:hypothetical protein
MSWILTKYLVTAAIIVLISEVAKRSGKLGALITALPMVAVLALIWMYIEKQPAERIGTYASYTFWYVLPTLPMFLIFPHAQQAFGFWAAMGISVVVTIGTFGLAAWALQYFGITLL